MKSTGIKSFFAIIQGIILLVFFNSSFSLAENSQKIKTKTVAVSGSNNSFPDAVDCIVQPFYRHRADGKPGREITLNFKGPKFSGKGTIELECSGKKEIIQLTINEGIDKYTVLLPPGAGVKSDCEAKVTLRNAKHTLSSSITVPAKRQWTVYIYPHSHVDIGYTNTHANVELIHKRNLINGIELAKKTADYPEGARYLWNPEVLWPVERYLKTATDSEKQEIIDAVKKGYLHLDAGYIHANTSASADEEFFEYFRFRDELAKLTGTKIETLVQVDVPGMSWGIVPVAAKLGIRYCFAMNNGSDRVGLSTDLSFKPFWWLGPDGKSKILFLQPGSYTPGAIAKGFAYWPLMAGQTDPSKLIQIVKTDHPRDHFVDKYLADKLPELEKADYYPYDIFAMSWAMADNTPIDADLPDAVKSWNEDYAFPHLIIASATDIMRTFEEKYGNQLPVLSGDFTEYWTDGLGTAAKQTGMNRSSKERLIQAETLRTMLHPGEPAPRAGFDEAWRNVIMGTEHTWCYMDPSKQPITNDILKVKFGYFQQAEDLSKTLLASALPAVSQGGSATIGVFNTLSWPRSGLAAVPAAQSKTFGSICDEKGKTILSQRLSTGELVFLASDVPALGSENYYLKNKKNKTKGNIALGNTLDNGILKVIIDPNTGDISSLTNGAHEFVDSKAACNLNSYRYLHGGDSPDKASGTMKAKISIKEDGPLMATLLVESEAEGCRSLSREITLIAGQPQVEIINYIDKLAILKKEGIHMGFAFNIPDPVTRADIPWGIMELEANQLSAANRNWITFQRWLDISNNERGVTWCSLDAPVFESGNITANILGAATNSPKWIRKLEPSATIYSWALNNHWHTNFPLSQEGKIQFRYRILPHNAKYDAVTSNRFGMEQAQPLIISPVNANFKLKPLLAIHGSPNVVLTILKTSDDGKSTQVRLRSISAKDELVKLDWLNHKPISVHIVDLDVDPVKREVQAEVLVPAMGFVTLDAVW
jgi:alpha-mannosidase